MSNSNSSYVVGTLVKAGSCFAAVRTTMIDPKHTDYLRSFLSPEEIISPPSEQYRDESLPWAAQKDLKPTLVIRPANVESLSKTLAYLSKTDLDLGIRSQGVGSASAKDVLISLTAFDEVQWDPQSEIVTVGAGQSWGEYYEKMDAIAPDYASQLLSPAQNLYFFV